jgi:hypothetical protein
MTKTDVCNLALAKIGERSITSIDNPNDKNAREAKLHYGQVRDEVLRAHLWSFALQSVVIEAEATTEELTAELAGWDHGFLLPADFLKLEKITGDGRKLDKFRMQRITAGRALLADAEELTLHYVARLDDPDEYDPLFTAALVTLLASRLARAITGSEQLEGSLLQRYEAVDLPAARSADGHDSHSNENHPLDEILAGALSGQRGDLLEEPIFVQVTPTD